MKSLQVSERKTHFLRTTALLALVGGLGGVVVPAKAQEAGKPVAAKVAAEASADLAEIVVTARKREESILDVPMAVSSLSSASLAKGGVVDVTSLSKVIPNMTTMNIGNGNLGNVGVFLRGIGTADHWITTDPGVGTYVDGVYLGRSVGANLALTGIERVEVDRGPQGTLFGRNSIGGAVNVITRKPDAGDTVEMTGTVGTLGRAALSGYGSRALTETLAVSLEGAFNRRDGIGTFTAVAQPISKVGQIDEKSGRVAVSYRPTSQLSVLLSADVADNVYGAAPAFVILHTTDASRTLGLTQAMLAPNRSDSNSTAIEIEQSRTKTDGFSGVVTYDIDDHNSIKIVASRRHEQYSTGSDLTTPIPFVFPETGDATQYSAEGQYNMSFDGFHAVAGLFYFKEKAGAVSPYNIFNTPLVRPLDGYQTTNSYAGYLHADFAVTRKLTAAGGVRLTRDEKNANAALNLTGGSPERVFGEKSWTAATWDASLTYALTSDIKAYVMASRGYQSGGFPARAGFSTAAAFVPYDPQYANNYELGIKGNIRSVVQFSLIGFYTRYTDLQLAYNQATSTGYISITNNAGESESYGVDAEANWRIGDALRLRTSLGLLHSEVLQVDPGVVATKAGFTPSYSPRYNLQIGPEYTATLNNGGALVLNASISARGAYYASSLNEPENRVQALQLLDMSATYRAPQGDWSLTVYGKNLTDEVYVTSILNNRDALGLTFSQLQLSNDRREIGARLSLKF